VAYRSSGEGHGSELRTQLSQSESLKTKTEETKWTRIQPAKRVLFCIVVLMLVSVTALAQGQQVRHNYHQRWTNNGQHEIACHRRSQPGQSTPRRVL